MPPRVVCRHDVCLPAASAARPRRRESRGAAYPEGTSGTSRYRRRVCPCRTRRTRPDAAGRRSELFPGRPRTAAPAPERPQATAYL